MNSTVGSRIEQLVRGDQRGIVRLATLLSPAVRIEPGLLRQVRLLLTELDASAEADLWFSDLIEAQNPGGIVLDVEVADYLRERLRARQDPLFDDAWKRIEHYHADAPWPVRVEEKINWLTVSSREPDQAAIGELLLAAGREIGQQDGAQAKDAARWLLGAFTRFPEVYTRMEAGKALEQGAMARVHGQLDASISGLPRDAMENWFPWLLAGLDTTSVGVRLLEDGVEVGPVELADAEPIAVPQTRPLMLELVWNDGLRTHSEQLVFAQGERRRVKTAARRVELRTVRGDHYLLEARPPGGEDEFPGGIDFSAIHARHRPFFGLKEALEQLDGLLNRMPGGWIALSGEPGIGKSALLCAYLDELERRGVAAAQHFLRVGPAHWADPQVLANSLGTQLVARYPDAAHGFDPAIGLASLLEQVAKYLYSQGGEPRLVLAIDGLDADDDEAALRQRLSVLSSRPPEGIYFLCTMRRAYRIRDWLEDYDPFADLALDKLDKQAVCRALYGHFEAALAPYREPEPDLADLLLDSAAGIPGRMRGMCEWILEQDSEDFDLGRMPPTLYGEMQARWRDLESRYGGEILRHWLGLLALARAPLPAGVLAILDGPTPSNLPDFLLELVAAGLLVETREYSAQESSSPDASYVISHPGVAAYVGDLLDDGQGTELHELLADQLGFWAMPAGLDEASLPPAAFRERYALRHGLKHRLEADRLDDAYRLCTNADYLAAKCGAFGVAALVADIETVLRRISDLAMRDHLLALKAAIRNESPRFAEHPEALAQLLYNRLRAMAWDDADIVNLLQIDTRPTLRLHQRIPQGQQPERRLGGVSASLTCAIALPDGRYAAGAADGNITIWAADDPASYLSLTGHAGAVNALATDFKGRYLLSASEDGILSLWDPDSASLIRTCAGHQGPVLDCAFIAEGQYFLSCSEDSSLRLWSAGNAEESRSFIGHAAPVSCFAQLPDGRLVSASEDNTLRVWNPQTGATLATLVGHKAAVNACAVIEDEKDSRILSGAEDGVLKLWSAGGEELATLGGHQGAITACRMLAGQRAVSASADGDLRVWDLQGQKELRTLRGHEGKVNGCAVLGDSYLLSYSNDGACRLWSLDDGRTRAIFTGQNRPVFTVLADSGKQRFATATDADLALWRLSEAAGDGVLALSGCALDLTGERVLCCGMGPEPRLWNDRGDLLIALHGHDARVVHCAMDESGRFLLSIDNAGGCRTWSAEGAAMAVYAIGDRERHALTTAAVAPSGERLYTCHDNGAVRIWTLDPSSLVEAGAFQVYGVSILDCALGHDEQQLVLATEQGEIMVLDSADGTRRLSIAAHDAPVRACAVNLFGNRILSGCADYSLRLWDFETGELRGELPGHQGAIRACAFTTGGDRALSCAEDGAIKLWDTQDLRCLGTFYGEAAFHSLALAATGHMAAAGDGDGNLWMLELHPA